MLSEGGALPFLDLWVYNFSGAVRSYDKRCWVLQETGQFFPHFFIVFFVLVLWRVENRLDSWVVTEWFLPRRAGDQV